MRGGTSDAEVEDVVESTNVEIGVEEIREVLDVEHLHKWVVDRLHAGNAYVSGGLDDLLLNRHNLNTTASTSNPI